MRAFAAALLPAHGGSGLRPLFVENLAQDTLRNLPRVPISERGYGDLLMLGMGGFTPLTGFMTRDEWHSVCDGFQLPDGTFWPMPVLLDVDADSVPSAVERVVLTYNGRDVGVLTVREVWHYGNFGYDAESRQRIGHTYARLAKMLAEQGHTVLCAVVVMVDNVRRWNREHIPN